MADRSKSPLAETLKLRDKLASKPMTCDALVEWSGYSKGAISRWVKRYRSQIRVAGWAPDKNGRLFVAVYQWSDKPDEPRPGRTLTGAEQMRKLRERRKVEQQKFD